MCPVSQLRHKVVECDNRACEVQGRVRCVGEVVAEAEVFCFGGDCDTVTFRQVRGIELFLLDVISLLKRVEGRYEPQLDFRSGNLHSNSSLD
jgi:hypothetical protein